MENEEEKENVNLNEWKENQEGRDKWTSKKAIMEENMSSIMAKEKKN